MDRLRIRDEMMWQTNSVNVLRHLHVYNKARDYAHFLDIFDKDLMDTMGEAIVLKKADDVFFEKICGLLPMYVK